MKRGLPAKLSIFLMMASPFVYANFDCLPLAGTTQFMSVSGTNGCLQRSFKMVNTSQCEVVLHEPQCTGVEGQWFGTYRYTGSVFNENPTDPDDPSGEILPSEQLTPVSTVAVEPIQNLYQDINSALITQSHYKTGMGVYYLSKGQQALSANDKIINDNVVTLSERMTQFFSNLSSVKSSVDAAKNSSDATKQAVNALDQKSTETLTKVTEANTTLTDLKTLAEDIQESNALDSLDNKQLHQQTHEAQAVAQTSIDAITEKLPLLDAINVKAGLASDYSSNAAYSAQQANLAANDAASIGVMTYQAANSALDNTNAIYSMLYEMTEGEEGEPGEGPDMTETNEILNSIKSDANTNTDRIIDRISPLESQLSDVNSNLGFLSEHVAQQLQGIQTAIENGSGNGGGDDDTATNEKLDGLGQKLDGIKGSLDTLSDTSGFSDDLAEGTAQGKSDLSDFLDGFDSDTMLTDRFKAITDESELTMKNSGLSKFADPSKFINDSGMVKPDSFDDLVSFAQRQPCSPYQITIRGNSYQMDLCPYAADSSSILTYVFAVLTAIFCFVMISQTLINERLS